MNPLKTEIYAIGKLTAYRGSTFCGWLIAKGLKWEARPLEWKPAQFDTINKAKRFLIVASKTLPGVVCGDVPQRVQNKARFS